MAILVVLLGSLLVYRGLGAVGVSLLSTWHDSARLALATMFAFTAASHFTPMRKDLIAMVPPSLPRPDLIVLLTGILELAGAGGLLLETTRFWAAWGLIALLVAIFPANVRAARQQLTLRGRPTSPLWIRAPLQFLFILWAWWVR